MPRRSALSESGNQPRHPATRDGGAESRHSATRDGGPESRQSATRDGGPSNRRAYLDWARGIGVLIMIEAHTLDSWTRVGDRTRDAYQWAVIVGGFGAPIFLFLAGITMALATGARTRRGMTPAEADRRAMRRAWQVFGLAFLFRLQSILISGGGLRAFLKVDILNVMGVSMIVAAVLWRLGSAPRVRALLFLIATVGTAMLTPPVRSTPLFDWLPGPIETYLRPDPGRTAFALFPWAGFLFAGVLAGMWLDVDDRTRERRRVVWLAGVGAAVGVTGYATAYLPALYQQTSYWTSSPTFFFVRLGVVATLVTVAFIWGRVRAESRSWVGEFGVASLFVYWIHVEMAYGVVSTPLHRSLTLEQAMVAMLVFALVLFGLVQLKHKVRASPTGGEKSTHFASFRPSSAAPRTHSS